MPPEHDQEKKPTPEEIMQLAIEKSVREGKVRTVYDPVTRGLKLHKLGIKANPKDIRRN
jgi:hypothetical protein